MLWRKDIGKVNSNIRAGFSVIREELDNHLDGINQNTEEIMGAYDYFSELESKLDKLDERLDKIEMLLNPSMEPLTCDLILEKREQEVFLALYTADRRLTAKEIARKLGSTESMVLNYLYNVIARGVPVIRDVENDLVLFSINSRFKELQAKKNVLKIDYDIKKVSTLRPFI